MEDNQLLCGEDKLPDTFCTHLQFVTFSSYLGDHVMMTSYRICECFSRCLHIFFIGPLIYLLV